MPINKSVAANLSLALISFVVAILMAEVMLKLFVGFPPTGPGHQELFVEYDSLLGWRKIPNSEGWRIARDFKVFERINAKGLRGPDRPYEKPHNKYRVLLLGDSFTEGTTQNLEDLVSQLLERDLNKEGTDCYEVINGGTGGYSTDQELLFFESEGVRYQPDLTVLLFVLNDVQYNNEPKYWRGFKPLFKLSDLGLVLTNVPVPPPDPAGTDSISPDSPEVSARGDAPTSRRRIQAWLADRSALYNVLRQAVNNHYYLHVAAIKLGLAEERDRVVPGSFRPWEVEYTPQIRKAWRITEALIGRLRTATAAAGSNLLIFYVPESPSVYPKIWEATKRKYGVDDEHWDPSRDDRELARICTAFMIDCIFPTTRFRAEARDLSSEGHGLYHEHDGHWNVHGHRLAARILAEHVRTRGEVVNCVKAAGDPVPVVQ